MAGDPIQLAWLLVAQWEGFRVTPYRDEGGTWTIGFGRTGPDVAGVTAPTTREAEEAWTKARLSWLWARIDRDLGRDMNVNQAAAVLSLAYNVGVGAVQRGMFWHYLQDGQWLPAAEQLMHFDKVHKGGILQSDPGLIRRRKAEKALFMTELT